MATNWDSILSNTNNLNDVLSILKKVLAELNVKADFTTIDGALETINNLDTSVQDKLGTLTDEINNFNQEKTDALDDLNAAKEEVLAQVNNITTVNSISDLNDIEKWHGRTVYVKDVANFKWDAADNEWVLASNAANSLIDSSGQNQQQVNDQQRNINDTLQDRTRIVDDYGADSTGVKDSSIAFDLALTNSGFLNLKDGGVYLLKSALTRSGFLKVRGDAELIFDFDGDGITVNGGGQDIDLGSAVYNGASDLGRKRKSVVKLNNTGKVSANKHSIINVRNDTDSVLALYLYNYGDTELGSGLYKNITGVGNGIIGDAIGAVRAVYGSGNKDCGYLKITGGHVENLNSVDGSGVNLAEDADAFVTQTKIYKADLYVSNITYKNVGKRIVKTQNNAQSITKVSGLIGSSAWVISNPSASANKGMFSIASVYGGVLMYTENVHIGGAVNYMMETSGTVDVIEFGNIFKPTYSAQIEGAQTRPHLHSSGDNSRYIHALSIIDNVAQGTSTNNATTTQIDVANIIDHKNVGAELCLKNHVSLGNVLSGAGSNAAILYQNAVEAFSISSNVIRGWQDGVYVKTGISTTKLTGAVVNNVTDNIGRNLVSEFEQTAIGKVAVSGNYSTNPVLGSKYVMLASTPTAPPLTPGSAPALPATPYGYMSLMINGVQRYIPIYS